MSESTRIGPQIHNCSDCGVSDDGYGQFHHHHIGCSKSQEPTLDFDCFVCRLLTEGVSTLAAPAAEPYKTLEELETLEASMYYPVHLSAVQYARLMATAKRGVLPTAVADSTGAT